jgi:molybdopterin-guanine dinucleotide biosynthesis protein A
MLARMAAVIAESGIREVRVVGEVEKYDGFGSQCVADRWPREGPLGGIITALANSVAAEPRIEWNLIVSCDMPFLTAEWLKYLVKRAEASDAQVVLARSEHGLEPLCACWRTDAIDILETAFERGVRKVTEGISLLRTEVLDERDWKRFDNAGRLFWNMNMQADYEEAKRVLHEG